MVKIIISILLFVCVKMEAQPVALFHAHNQMPQQNTILGIVADTFDAAYSLRKVNTSYSGKCLTVRKAGTLYDTLQVGFINDYLDTASLKTFIGYNNGYIYRWNDQSGNGKDMIEADFDSSFSPLIINAGALIYDNEKVAIQFQSGDQLRHNTDVTSSDGAWISFAVAQISTTSGTMSIWDGDGFISGGTSRVGQFIRVASGTPQTIGFTGGTAYSDATTNILSNTRYLFSARRNSGTIEIYINNASNGSSAASGSNNTGGSFTGISGSQLFTGKIQEVIHFGRDKSADRTTIQTNINTYYSIY